MKKVKRNNNLQNCIVKSKEVRIDEKTMSKAIVEAYQIIEKQKIEARKELEDKAKEEWKRTIGQKDYLEDEKWYLERIHIFRNNLVATWKLLFFKEENARDLRSTLGLMRLAVVGIFNLCKWFLYLVSVVVIYVALQNGKNVLSMLAFALVVWMLARVFRVASFEVQNMKDGNVLIAIFSGSVSFVAMIVAMIAIFI